MILADRYDELMAEHYPSQILREPPRVIVGLVYAWAIERVASDKFDDWLTELRDLLP